MPNVYIEAHPRGRPEGSAVQDFVVEDHADHVLAAFKTQREAIEWARKNNHSPLVAPHAASQRQKPRSLASA